MGNDISVTKRSEYIPDPNEDIIEDVPSETTPVIVTDTSSDRNISLYRLRHIVWFILGFVEIFLLFRFTFKMIGANTLSGFTDFIYTLSTPLVIPFVGIIPSAISGVSLIEWSTLIAMVVYLLLAYSILELLQLMRPIRASSQRRVIRRTRYAL